MDAVYRLGYTDQPDYSKLKDLFTKELKALGCCGDGKDSLDWITSGKVCFPNKYLVKKRHLLFVSEQILLLSPLTQPKAKAAEKASPVRMLHFKWSNHYIISYHTQKRRGRPKRDWWEDSERGSEGEEPPPKRKKRMAKTKPANIEGGVIMRRRRPHPLLHPSLGRRPR